MCTAISFVIKDFYFGRNLDLEYCYDEKITVTPRYYVFNFRNGIALKKHYAIIGMAYVQQDYPLYYDAVNECGLGISGLNFPDNAVYEKCDERMCNIAPFEFIPWILSQCRNVDEAVELIHKTTIADIDFTESLKNTPLHWFVSDRNKSVTVEPLADGTKVYDNPVGVLTNNPPFDIQMFNLNNYLSVTREKPENKFSDKILLKRYSNGLGGVGLPGDLSSASRFVRAAFTKLNSVCNDTEEDAISQFFHILNSVYQQQGCVKLGEKLYEKTQYSSCCNADRGIYYYTTYNNSQISAVDMNRENLDDCKLISYPLLKKQSIVMQN